MLAGRASDGRAGDCTLVYGFATVRLGLATGLNTDSPRFDTAALRFDMVALPFGLL
jgi:hypothetical protein